MTFPSKLDLPPEQWDRLFAPSSCLAMITTADSNGRVNAASFGTCVRVNHEPVYIAFTVTRAKDTCNNVLATGEFVVNLPSFDRELLEKVRVDERAPGLYEVNVADAQAVLEQAGRVLTELWPTVQPALSLQRGVEYRISSAAGDGVLSSQGFTLTAPKLAARAGLQVGDTILSVNGRPVDGFASLYRIFREVRQDPTLRTVRVELARQGTRRTQTYRIR